MTTATGKWLYENAATIQAAAAVVTIPWVAAAWWAARRQAIAANEQALVAAEQAETAKAQTTAAEEQSRLLAAQYEQETSPLIVVTRKQYDISQSAYTLKNVGRGAAYKVFIVFANVPAGAGNFRGLMVDPETLGAGEATTLVFADGLIENDIFTVQYRGFSRYQRYTTVKPSRMILEHWVTRGNQIIGI